VLAIKDFATNLPDIWISLKEFLTTLKSPQGKNWMGLHVAPTHLFYYMVSNLHGLITPFMDLASTFSYNEAVKNEQPISAQAYADVLFHAITHVMCLRTVFASGNLGKYHDVPLLMSLFPS
jgi:hypothetical protein